MKKGLLLILLIFALMPAQAQDEAEPLLEMLVHLPLSMDESPELVYVDIDLYLSGWLDVPEVNSSEDFEALSENERTIYLNSLPFPMPFVIASVPHYDTFEDFSQSSGIDYFSIEQVLGLFDRAMHTPFFALTGDFNEGAIIERQLEAGYGQREEASWTVLCPEADCARDFAIDNAAFLSGGFIVRDNLLIKLRSSEYLAASEAIIEGAAASRLDVPDYGASAKLLLNSGEVSHAIFVEPARLAEFNERLEVDSADIEALPAYGLVTIAELVFAEDEITEVHVILTYDNAEDAETAAENLEENLDYLAAFYSSDWETLDAELENVEVIEDGATGLFLVQAVMSSPMQRDGSGMSSSSLFRRIYMATFTFSNASWLLVED